VSPRVYLVRHGRAEARNPGGDASRRLTPEGASAFEAMARGLGPELSVSRVVTSPLLRARQTALILSAVTGARLDEAPELSAGASEPRELLALAVRLGPGTALVGHNPELADAASAAAGSRVDFPAGAVAALDVVDREARLAWLRVP
jgi:phosphohistidine phosphatase